MKSLAQISRKIFADYANMALLKNQPLHSKIYFDYWTYRQIKLPLEIFTLSLSALSLDSNIIGIYIIIHNAVQLTIFIEVNPQTSLL
jgi:hypothetical protein